jgi:dihydroflavonol-4-reductase
MNTENDTILVTGSSGIVGRQLLYEFAKRGISPIAHLRKSSDASLADSLGLEKRYADLRNQAELEQLVQGVDSVIHTAAMVNFRQDRMTQFVGLNVQAAADLFKAASAAGVKRFVHVSTVAAVGATPRSGDVKNMLPKNYVREDQIFNLTHLKIPYIQTKRAAETELHKLAEESNTELVIVNPSIILAPSRRGHDREKAIRAFRRPIMFHFPNWVNLVDVRDVAPGIVGALEHGRPNERYILAGDNILARDLVLAISAILGKAPHLIRPARPLLKVATRLSFYFSKMTGRSKIRIYPDLVKLLDFDWAFSSMKARTELGFKPRSIYISLEDLFNDNFLDSYMRPTELPEKV